MTWCDAARADRGLDASEPVEPGVRVDAARALADAGHRVDDANRFQELEILVAALPFDTQAERRAVAGRKIATVEAIREDCLRMLDLEQVVSLVPAIVRVDHDIARCRRDAAGGLEHALE